MKNENRLLRIITEEDIKKVKEEGKLISMSLRVPSPCNLSCFYCYGGTEPTGEPLTFEEIKDAINQGADLGARTVSIVGEGEPLLYSHFNELIAYIAGRGMAPTVYTNCTLVSEELAQFLYDNNSTVVGKHNALTPEKQDEICRVPGTYERIMRGLSHLLNAGFADTTPSRLGIHCVVLKDNLEDIRELYPHWRDLNIIPQVQAFVYPSAHQKSEYLSHFNTHAPSAQEVRLLFEDLSQIDKNEFGIIWDPILAYPIAPDGCRLQCGTAGITQEGNVQICSYTEDALGNIREQSLREILASERVKKVRNIGEELNYPGHRYGCRAHALNLTGDRFAPDPFYNEFLKAPDRKS